MLKEKNVLSLDDSNVILRNIIDIIDAPFIYEKLGVSFDHLFFISSSVLRVQNSHSEVFVFGKGSI